MFPQKLDQSSIIRQDIDRPRLNFGKHSLMEVLDLKHHEPKS